MDCIANAARAAALAAAIGAASALALVAVPAAAEAGIYLVDLLARPDYKAGWDAMLASRKGVDGWITDHEGPSTPSVDVTVGGETWTFTTLCKPHDCGDNMLNVVFAPAGKPAYAMLVVAGEKPKWFGEPPKEVKKALRKMAKQKQG